MYFISKILRKFTIPVCFLILFISLLMISYNVFLEKSVGTELTYSTISHLNSNEGETYSEEKYDFFKNQKLRLIIDSLKIDARVMQGNNNDYYLKHSPTNEYDKYGSITLDYRNDIYKDNKLLLYGHNSTKKMLDFKKLENYMNEDFYKNNRLLQIQYENEETSNYIIFSVIVISQESNEHTVLKFEGDDYKKHISFLKKNSIYNVDIDVNQNSKIIIMQTCNYNPKGTWLLVSAVKV